jgi:hypothetical protein
MKAKTAQVLAGLIMIIISSCGCRQNNEQIATKKHNYLVILDLSDRLLNNGQTEKDSAIILAAFNEFEKTAKSPLIVTSNDRFVVRIIAQKGSPLHQDLSSVDAAHKNSSFVAFKENLSKTISELYHEAHLGNRSNDYFGIDIWKFFNDEINAEMRPGSENKVVVLTDGYFDFNDNTHVIRTGNKYTSTSFLSSLRGKDWQAEAAQDSTGLIPVSIRTKAQWIIAGLHGKQADDILVEQKLEYFWKKWLKESGAEEPKIILDNASTVMVNQYRNK